MKWKEQLDQLPSDEGGAAIERMHPTDRDNLKAYISTEIIEKLIADIPDRAGERYPKGFDLKPFKQQLRFKWL